MTLRWPCLIDPVEVTDDAVFKAFLEKQRVRGVSAFTLKRLNSREELQRFRVTHLLILDYHLVPEAVAGTGLDVARALVDQTPFCPVVVHSTHRNGKAMTELLRDAGWRVERVPFQGRAWGEAVARLLS